MTENYLKALGFKQRDENTWSNWNEFSITVDFSLSFSEYLKDENRCYIDTIPAKDLDFAQLVRAITYVIQFEAEDDGDPRGHYTRLWAYQENNNRVLEWIYAGLSND